MLRTTDCYKKLGKSVILEELREWCEQQQDWSQMFGSSFMLKPAPELILKDPFIKRLIDEGWKEPHVMKNYPHSFYNFHIDKDNKPTAINLLLGENENCCTVFLGDQLATRQHRALELKYEYGHYYLLNTHIPHGVFNFGKDRYLFTICPPGVPNFTDTPDTIHKSNMFEKMKECID